MIYNRIHPLLFLALSCIYLSGAPSKAESSLKGEFIQNTIRKESIISSRTGSFELMASEGRWGFRLFEPDQYQDWSMFVLSDFDSTYSSVIITKNDGVTLDASKREGYGNFERGPLPNKFDDRVASQILSLAYILYNNPQKWVEGNMLIGPAVPVNVHRIVAREQANLRSEVIYGKNGVVERVNFWAVKAGSSVAVLENSANCFLSASLEYTSRDSIYPTSFKYTVYTKVPNPEKTIFLPMATSEYLFSGHIEETTEANINNEIAYKPDYAVTVNDYRFGERTGYLIEPSSGVPFEQRGGAGFEKIKKDIELHDMAKASITKRRYGVVAILGILPLLLAAWMWKISPKGEKTK